MTHTFWLKTLLLFVLAFSFPLPPLFGATLSLCKGHAAITNKPHHKTYLLKPNGDTLSLTIGKSGLGMVGQCTSKDLPIPASQVLAAQLIPQSKLDHMKTGVLLITMDTKDGLIVSEIVPLDPDADTGVGSPSTPQSKTTNAIPPRTAWVWEPRDWQQKDPTPMLTQLKQMGMSRIYTTIPVSTLTGHVQKTNQLKTFIEHAHRHGIDVWAVEGDPKFVLDSYRKQVLAHARAFAHYNSTVEPHQQIKGIQYDVEPYILLGYGLQPDQWNEAYVDLLKAIDGSVDLPLDVVLPFWFTKAKTHNGLFLNAIAPLVERITIMDYRTDTDQITQFAAPYLQWGNDHNKEIAIALEVGPIPDQTKRVYRPGNNKGRVWLLDHQGYHVLLVLSTHKKNPFGPSYRYSHQMPLKGKETTFNKHQRKFWHQLPKIEAQLNQWDSFSGAAIHHFRAISELPTSH